MYIRQNLKKKKKFKVLHQLVTHSCIYLLSFILKTD